MNRCRGQYCIIKVPDGERYCAKCKVQAEKKFKAYNSLYESGRRERDQQERQFYNSKEWKAFRLEILSENPICAECKRAFAFAVHHIVPLKEDWNRRLDPTNVKGLCTACHSRFELTERNKQRITSK